MAKMTYDEAIAFMEQHAIYCETDTRPDWYVTGELRKPVYWIRLAAYMNKKREAEQVLNDKLQEVLVEMAGVMSALVLDIEVRDGKVVSISPIRTEQPDANEPDFTNIKPVGGIQ